MNALVSINRSSLKTIYYRWSDLVIFVFSDFLLICQDSDLFSQLFTYLSPFKNYCNIKSYCLYRKIATISYFRLVSLYMSFTILKLIHLLLEQSHRRAAVSSPCMNQTVCTTTCIGLVWFGYCHCLYKFMDTLKLCRSVQ